MGQWDVALFGDYGGELVPYQGQGRDSEDGNYRLIGSPMPLVCWASCESRSGLLAPGEAGGRLCGLPQGFVTS